MIRLITVASVMVLSSSVLPSVLSPAWAQSTQSCAPANEQQVAALFDRWNASLKTLNADEVVKNYAPDAILLATVSNRPRLTQADRKDYFVHFLEAKPVGSINMRVIKLGCNDALDAGVYTFTLGDGRTVEARFSFTYVFRDGQWLISSHHSSAMPEPIAPVK